MAQFQVGTFCWADPGLDFSNMSVCRSLTKSIRSHFTHSRSAYSSSSIQRDTNRRRSSYQPGGTFMTTTDKWTTRSTGKILEDPTGLGRWSGLTFLGKRGKKLTVLTAYRSPRQQPSAGFGFYDQQYALLLSQGVKNPNVRKQFITDITSLINDLQSAGHEIIVSLDANEIPGQDSSHGIRHLMEECTLLDLHSLGPEEPPATYKYGNHRKIDYMLGSTNVVQCVRRAGFLAYDNGIFSKHRGLFIDIDFQDLMGAVDMITPVPARGLNSENQVSVDKYLEALKTYLADHHVEDRIQDLQVVASSLTLPQCKAAYDAIDRDVTRAMLHAEKEAKRPSGKYSWSPKLREAGLLARYWHLRLRSLESGNTLTWALSQLTQRLRTLHITLVDALGGDLTLVTTRWKESLATLKVIRGSAFDYRALHLQSTLATYQALEPQGKANIAANNLKIRRILQLLNTERMRKPFRNIHASMAGNRPAGLSKLFVPIRAVNRNVAAKFCQPDGSLTHEDLIAMAKSDKTSVEYATILDCDEIERELLLYNRNWFRQASDTPFGHGELYNLVGYDGLTEAADNIVSGFCIDHMGITMSRELQVFLEECKRPSSISEIRTVITLDEFKANVKKWKESTSTSPSGRHLGHYRTAILDDQVAAIHTDMLNIPIKYGFAPTRWTQSITPLIEKDEGKPYLTRLRVIHLFEADYNLFLKILFGKRLVRNGEKSEALNDQQHGSRPRRMTTDALFLSRLEKDLIRQTKSNSAHMDNDATGCYDRIITSLGMIACRRLGMPSHAIRCQADTLLQMKYAVKHVYGVSSDQYASSLSEPLFGTGQGSGASPAIWLSLVVILLNSLDRMSKEDQIPALSFADPWSELLAEWRVGAFVDDTNQGVVDATGTLSTEELVEHLRTAGQMWERLLHISGGSLNLSKCSWTMQYWTWINGRPCLQAPSAHDPLLLMTSGDAPDTHIIKRYTNEAEVIGLGVHMNFFGTFPFHATTMRRKFDGLARCLRQSHLSPSLSRAFYTSFYLPSVKYSLPVTSMSDTELHKVQSKMTASILNSLGYNQHYPHAVAFASEKVFGCGLSDLRIEQGLSQIQALLDYVGTYHKVGTVILISLRHLQIQAGVSFDLLQHPHQRICYLSDCWLLHVRNFCAKFNISLRIRANRVPQSARDADSFLMEHALTLGLRPQEISDLNLARTYLQVTTVSDIASACGKYLHWLSWKGQRIPDRTSKFAFARQPYLSSGQRGLWRKLMRSLLVPLHRHKLSSLPLRLPLGNWTAESNQVWGSMLWDSNLYRQDPNHRSGDRDVAVHFPRQLVHSDGTRGVETFFNKKPDWYSATIPRLAAPTDISGSQFFTAISCSVSFPIAPAAAATFHEWLKQLPPAENRLVSQISFDTCDAEEVLIQYLQLECPVYIGTDGGHKHHRGSFSWLLYSPGHEKLVLNEGPVDGWHKCQSSLRSEATALASVTLYLNELITFYDITIRCSFVLYVDSTSAISNVLQIRDLIPKRKFANNADILSTLRSAPDVIRHFTLHHVKSHQDDKTSYDQLPFSAQLNILCDRMTTNQLLRQSVNAWEATQACALSPRNLPIEVFYGSQNITSHYIARLRDEISLDIHRQFIQKKYKWESSTWASIAWESFYRCATKLRLDNAVNRSKLVHNWLNLGTQRAHHSKIDSDTVRACPYCSLPEDFRHLLTCEAPRALTLRYAATLKLKKALRSGTGDTSLLRAIQQWTVAPSDPVLLVSTTFDAQHHTINKAVASQTAIGWLNLFRGFISTDWGDIDLLTDQTVSPETRQSKVTAHLSLVIGALQNYSLALWTSRNEVLHENSTVSCTIRQETLHRDIIKLYSIGHTFSPVIQSYFSQPLDERLKQSPRQKERWLRLALLATSHATSKGSSQQMMSTYFPYTSSGTEPQDTSNSTTVPPCTVTPTLHQAQLPQYFPPKAREYTSHD